MNAGPSEYETGVLPICRDIRSELEKDWTASDWLKFDIYLRCSCSLLSVYETILNLNYSMTVDYLPNCM